MIIFQQFDNLFEEIKKIVVPYNTEYCNIYNIKYYSLISNIDKDESLNLKKYWNKIILAEKILHSTSEEWILMLDGDILLYKQNNIELITKIIPECKDFGICRVSNKLEDCFWNINIGSLFIRNTNFSKDILKKMIEIGSYYDFKVYEQPIFQDMLKTNYSNILEKTEIFSPICFNHTGGPFVFHPCGHEDTTTQNVNAISNKINKLKQEIERVKK